MKLMKRIGAFILLEKSAKFLLMEAFFFLGYARILKSMPFSKTAPLLGASMEETSYIYDDENLVTIRKVSQSVHLMSRYTLWESQCLVRAIAAMKMLERRKIDSTLYLGTARDENGKMIAHAWLRSGSFYLTGSEVMDRFSTAGMFAKKTSL